MSATCWLFDVAVAGVLMDGNDDTDLYGDLITGQAEEGQGHFRAEAEEVHKPDIQQQQL